MRQRPAPTGRTRQARKNEDGNFSAEKYKRELPMVVSEHGRTRGLKMYPDFVSAICDIFYTAQKAQKRRNKICDDPDVSRWRCFPFLLLHLRLPLTPQEDTQLGPAMFGRF